jgi:predicted negative regulator of RcsB-dependent stress response
MYILKFRINELEKNENLNNKEIENLKKANNILLIVAFIITILGVFNYLILKKKELEKRNQKFSYLTFFIGKSNCRNDKYENISILNNVKNYKKII